MSHREPFFDNNHRQPLVDHVFNCDLLWSITQFACVV